MTSKFLQNHQEGSLKIFPRIHSQDSSNSNEQNVLTEDNLTDENDEEIEDRPTSDCRSTTNTVDNLENQTSLKRNSSYSMWRLLDDNESDESTSSISPPKIKKMKESDEVEPDHFDEKSSDHQKDLNFNKIRSILSPKFLTNSSCREEIQESLPVQQTGANLDLDVFKNVFSLLMSKRQSNEVVIDEKAKTTPNIAQSETSSITNFRQFLETNVSHPFGGQQNPLKTMSNNPFLHFTNLLQHSQPTQQNPLHPQINHLYNLMNIMNQQQSAAFQKKMIPTTSPSLGSPHRGSNSNKSTNIKSSNPFLDNLTKSFFLRNSAKVNGKSSNSSSILNGKGFPSDEFQNRINQTPAVRDTNSLLASAQLAAACNSDTFGLTCTLTPVHLRKAKLMFFYVRYPNSSLLKVYFPDVRFNKNNTAQLVKWFSNFREFYYIQMEKFARMAIADGVRNADEIQVTVESELYRSLNLHYNRNQQIEVPEQFLSVVEATLKEFYLALSTGKDNEQSWKKPIYKIIARLDQPVPEFFKSPNWMSQLTEN